MTRPGGRHSGRSGKFWNAHFAEGNGGGIFMEKSAFARSARNAEEIPSLKEIYARFFALGNIVACRFRDDLSPESAERVRLLQRHFGILTPENEMKPAVLRPGAEGPGAWDWSCAERLLDFAEKRGFRFHGHALAWHSQSPRWLAPQGISRAEAIANLEGHIEAVMLRFGNRVESWDALNEAVADGGPEQFARDGADIPWHLDAWDWTQKGALRKVPDESCQTDWLRAIGPEYAEIAFGAARRAARENGLDVMLYYNDYNLDIPRKRFAVYHMVRDINKRHLDARGERLIDAIGMQGHYWLSVPRLAKGGAPPPATLVSNVRDSLARFASLGVNLSVTELDVAAGSDGILDPGQDLSQAVMCARLFSLFKSFSKARPGVLRRVSIWGVDDGSSWRSFHSPLLFDRAFKPKLAFWAAADPGGFLREHAPMHMGEFADDAFEPDCNGHD